MMNMRLAPGGCTIASGGLMPVTSGSSWIFGPAREESERAIREQIERKRRGDLRGVVVVV